MKNTLKIFAVITLVLLTGYFMAACGNGTNDPSDNRTTDPCASGHDFTGVFTVTNTTYPATSTQTCSRCTATGNGRTTAIGDTGPGGGKIYLIENPGREVEAPAGEWTTYTAYYFEAAPVDIAGEYKWASAGKEDFTIPGTGTAAFHVIGRVNTALILASEGDPDAPAAKACINYRGGGKDDWYLPDNGELQTLFYQNGESTLFDNFTDAYYWSSEPYQANKATAVYPGGGAAVGNKTEEHPVRATRAF